jgi:Immunity protein Imm1
LSGQAVDDHVQLLKILESCRSRAPFFAELVEEVGHKLLIGVGGPLGCAQFSRADGAPPYLMALPANQDAGEGFVEFLCGNTPTPVPTRYILSREAVMDIACVFLQTGRRSNDVSWEPI